MKVQVNERGQRIGQGHRRAVLTDAEVEQLLEDRGPEDAPRRSYAQLAKKYRVSKSCVRDICTGRRRGQHVIAAQDGRDGLDLDRGRGGITLFVDGAQQGGTQSQGRK